MRARRSASAAEPATRPTIAGGMVTRGRRNFPIGQTVEAKAHGGTARRSRSMPVQEHPDQARANAEGLCVWLIIIGLVFALLVIAGRYGMTAF
jgi:hypothetical protein